MKNVVKGFFGGLLKAGFLITIGVYILNTFILKGMGIEVMMITSLIGLIAYIGFAWRSSNQANRHQRPEDAEKDSIGDILVLLLLFCISLLWTMLPNFSGAFVAHTGYFINLAFFWAMFLVSLFETTMTIKNSLYQMYRMEQVTMERTP